MNTGVLSRKRQHASQQCSLSGVQTRHKVAQAVCGNVVRKVSGTFCFSAPFLLRSNILNKLNELIKYYVEFPISIVRRQHRTWFTSCSVAFCLIEGEMNRCLKCHGVQVFQSVG